MFGVTIFINTEGNCKEKSSALKSEHIILFMKLFNVSPASGQTVEYGTPVGDIVSFLPCRQRTALLFTNRNQNKEARNGRTSHIFIFSTFMFLLKE